MNDAFLSIGLRLRGRDASICEQHFFAAGALAVSYFDAADEPILEPAPGTQPLWSDARIEALFAAEAVDVTLLPRLARDCGCEVSELLARSVANRAWEREWLRDFRAMRFGRRLWIAPTHDPVREPGACVVNLDPGLAFGTGTHESTRMCLEWLDGQLHPGDRVLDYGCGSGILAIAALRLGAARADAYDIDPQALAATRCNAIANDCLERLRIHDAARGLPDDCDLLLANILANTLVELAAYLSTRLRSGGRIVLAGILAEQQAAVTEAYRPWFDMRLSDRQNEWICLAGIRR
ncbi:MAG: 50S ribosomal protein L11 methyltransferase [Steroidobacteraceae bacterium]